MKICTKCKEYKTFECFFKDRSRKTGFADKCNDCVKIYILANADRIREGKKKWHKENFEKTKKRQQKYRLDNAEKIKEDKRKYRLENAEKIAAWHRKRYLETIDERKEYNKQYRLANPEKDRDRHNKRRARKLANGVYKISLKELKKIYSSPCFYCGSTDSIQADHVIPVSRGGQHSIGNLLPACAKCNMSKGSKLLIEWRGRKSNLK